MILPGFMQDEYQVGDGTTKPNQYFLKDKTGNNIHWKSLEAGSNDYLIVTASGNCPTDSLRFIRETGIATGVSRQGGSNALNLLVTGGMDGTEEILSVARATTVMDNDTTGHEILTETGALGLVSYTRMHKTVVLIPVNTATLPDNTTGIQQRLNELYAPAIVEWTVKAGKRLDISQIEEGDFKTTGIGLLSKYTGDMCKVINAYEKTQKAEVNTVYLFFLNVPDSQLEGFMPLTGEYGFIFNYNNNPDLLAHELSHGTFNLRHTFSDKAQYYFNKGATKNLLDYSNSTELWKYQWDLIHNPESIMFAWAQDEEEGAIIDLSIMFDSDDLKKYNAHIKDLKQLALFNVLYIQLDKSEKHIAISSFKANLNNLIELKRRHRYSNGYFLNAEKKEAFWGLLEYKPGDEDDPHKIVLFSSKNYEISGGKVKGDGFKRASTIFEEFFHAAHFLYLEENGGYINDLKFLTQTETEVELAQAFAYYLMTINKTSKFVNVNTPYFDTYGILRQGNTAELNPEITEIFDIIIKNKELTVNELYVLKEAIKSAVALKKQTTSYSDMDIALLNWDFAFFKFLIKEAFK